MKNLLSSVVHDYLLSSTLQFLSFFYFLFFSLFLYYLSTFPVFLTGKEQTKFITKILYMKYT